MTRKVIALKGDYRLVLEVGEHSSETRLTLEVAGCDAMLDTRWTDCGTWRISTNNTEPQSKVMNLLVEAYLVAVHSAEEAKETANA